MTKIFRPKWRANFIINGERKFYTVFALNASEAERIGLEMVCTAYQCETADITDFWVELQ